MSVQENYQLFIHGIEVSFEMRRKQNDLPSSDSASEVQRLGRGRRERRMRRGTQMADFV
jgi:hypothetical protein